MVVCLGASHISNPCWYCCSSTLQDNLWISYQKTVRYEPFFDNEEIRLSEKIDK